MKVLLACTTTVLMCLCVYAATSEKGHRSNSMFYPSANWLKLTPNPGYYIFGRFKLVGLCGSSARRSCGKFIVTKHQCQRFYCCWDEASNYCYRATFHILNYLEKEGSWTEFSQWSACSAPSLCSAGTQTRTRTCTGGTAGTGGCPGLATETQACSTCTNSWSTWGTWSVCSSSDISCLVGSRSRTRTCTNSVGVIQSSVSCNGGTAAATQSEACNTNLCPQFSAWTRGACSVTCGGGTQTQSRTCTTTPATTLPSSCYSTSLACNTFSCSQDKNLDLMILLDSTAILDSCASQSVALQLNPPFMAGSAALTSTNFPNFFQQNLMATTLLSSWQSVLPGMTQVGIIQQSDQCNISDPSLLNSVQTFGSLYNPASVLQTSYLCGSDHRYTQLRCGVDALNTVLNRPDVPDVIIQFIPDMSKLNPTFLAIYRTVMPLLPTLLQSKRLLVISAANHATLTAAQIQTNVEFAQQWACGSVTPTVPCSTYYLGTIYDTVGVLANMRTAVSTL